MSDRWRRASAAAAHCTEPPAASMAMGMEKASEGREGLLAKLHELCPDIRRLGLYTVILGKGHRY